MITLLDKQKIILKHHHDGKSQRAIHRETGISRKTIRKYIKEYESKKAALIDSRNIPDGELIQSIVEKPTYDSSSRKKTKLTPQIIERIEYYLQENETKRAIGRAKQQKKKIDIYEALIEEGFDISYPTICNTIRTMEKKNREAFIKQHYSLGEVCEFDWGEVKLTIDGRDVTLQLAVFTSAKGNYRYARLFYNQKTESFLESHASFFEQIKGVYHLMVYDNTRVVVKKFVGPSEKEPTEALIKLSLYYGFNYRFCNVQAGWEKGHVERSVEYIRRKAFSRRDKFLTLKEAQEYLETVCNQLNLLNQADSGKSALDILKEEQPYLLPRLPKYDTARVVDLRVDKYSTVCIDTCRYSVPDQYVGEFLFVKIYTTHICCYYKGQKVAVHERKYGLRKWSIQIAHYTRTLKKKPGALAGSLALKQAEPELQKIYHKYYTEKEKEFIELLELVGEKGWAKVQSAVEALKKASPTHLSTEKIVSICNRSNDIFSPKDEDDTVILSKSILKAYSQILNGSANTFEQGAQVL
ncbi:MAG: IS21 family transposase [Dethiobacteria bacterium]|jgi:transposase